MIRVLLADADPAARNALTLLLTHKLGITDICEAANSEMLHQHLVNCQPDVLLLDWSLLCCCSLRSLDEAWEYLSWLNPQVRLGILSLNADHEAEAQALGALFIHKGADTGRVLEQLQALMEPEKGFSKSRANLGVRGREAPAHS